MDLIPSFCAGLSQAIVGHPIDTAKIFIQNNKSLYNLKARDYYRGFTYPLITALGFNMIVFPSYCVHRVLPMTKGTRYAVVGWAHGNSFR